MSRAGATLENPRTGERLVVDVFVRPGGAVLGEHVHPTLTERFTVLGGKVGFCLNGRLEVAEAGRQLVVPPGTPTTGGTPRTRPRT